MANVSVRELGLDFVRTCLSLYWENIPFFWIYLIGILFLFLVFRKEGTSEKKLFLPYTVFLFLTIFNPVLVKVFYGKMNSDAVYYRFFWLLPVSLVLGYLCTEAVFLKKSRTWKALTALLLTGAVILFGNPVMNLPGELKKPENMYRMSPSVFAVCKAIHEDTEEEQPKVIVDSSMHMLIRQYDPSIRLTLNRDYVLLYEGNTTTSADTESKGYQLQSILMDGVFRGELPHPTAFYNLVEYTATQYLVVLSENPAKDIFEKLGYTDIGDYGEYTIFRTNVPDSASE